MTFRYMTSEKSSSSKVTVATPLPPSMTADSILPMGFPASWLNSRVPIELSLVKSTLSSPCLRISTIPYLSTGASEEKESVTVLESPSGGDSMTASL